MKLQTEHLKLYAVTDRSWLGERTLARQVEESLAGGATMVQLREKGMDRETLRRRPWRSGQCAGDTAFPS